MPGEKPANSQTIGEEHVLHYWQEARIEVLRLYSGRVPDGGHNFEGSPTHLDAWRILEGRVEVVVPNARFECGPGEWLFLPPGHRVQRFTPESRIWSANFRLTWPDRRSVVDIRPGIVVRKSESEVLDRLSLKVLETIAALPGGRIFYPNTVLPLETYLSFRGAFEQWLAAAVCAWRAAGKPFQSAGSIDARIELARQFIERQPLDDWLDAEAVAAAAGISPGHLNRLFREHHHTTTHGYFENLRTSHARERLLNPETRIKEVAAELGFLDLSKFSTWFRRVEGRSPRAFRKLFFG